MKLIQMKLEGFKGIKSYTFSPNGRSIVSVYGTNASGKTTLADAMSWLLCDKASTDEVGFSPKPKGKDGKEIHFVDTTVDAVFDCGSFRKTLSEVWTKKRGSSESVYSGNTVSYFLNDVPVTKKDYDAAVTAQCHANLLQVLSKPGYFSGDMPWQSRREMLLSVCGEVTEADVLSELPDLESRLSGHSVEEFRAITKASIKKINARMAEIPARIDELKRVISSEPESIEYWRIKVNRAKERLNAANAKMAAGPQLEVAECESKLRIARADHDAVQNRISAMEEEKIRTIEKDIDDLKKKISFMESYELPGTSAALGKMIAERQKYSEEYNRVFQSRFSSNNTCPTCGQTLPESMVEESISRFNLDRSNNLMSIREYVSAHCSKEMIEQENKKLKTLNQKIESEKSELLAMVSRLENAKTSRTVRIPFETTDEYKCLTEHLEQLKSNDTCSADANHESVLAEHDIAEYSQKIAEAEASRMASERVESLSSEMKDLQFRYDDAAAAIDLCDEFIRLKVSMLNDSINSKFKTVKFKLFTEQINGGMKECCDVLVPGDGSMVEYKSANNAAKINAGLEIIQTISNHFKCSLPVFVDNAESVVNLIHVDYQVIRLVVSENDPVLRVE